MDILRHKIILVLTVISSVIYLFSVPNNSNYRSLYKSSLDSFILQQRELMSVISSSNLQTDEGKLKVKNAIHNSREQLKKVDFWLRYLEPIAYKKINGPLPVEWETEVYEKFEKPYKRVGAGHTLAESYLAEIDISKDSLLFLISQSIESSQIFYNDSITRFLKSHHHFFLINRLAILNLATIYTTGFECPEKSRVIPELEIMLGQLKKIYLAYNISYPEFPITDRFLKKYDGMLFFVGNQIKEIEDFDHFTFIKNYVNPLFLLNQEFIILYKVQSNSYNDFTLNNHAKSIFAKNLYEGLDVKGVYKSVTDERLLQEIHMLGKLLFYDPILSGNNKRSCASCHKPKEFFTDTGVTTSLQFNGIDRLERNTPSLINVKYNHLIMLDGKHINLKNQMKDVLTNPKELNNQESDVLKKVLSCKEYKMSLKKFAKISTNKKLGLRHIESAISIYIHSFSEYDSPFDKSMNDGFAIDTLAIKGFNLYMGKAECATCHFIPQFNGVKPPYMGSEFEVIGVPQTNDFALLSKDAGRYLVHPVEEMRNAFRTTSLRNAFHTKPYMHNGVLETLDQLIEFYDFGGGIGKGLNVENQTLSSDSLKLVDHEKIALIKFIELLTEDIPFEEPPAYLPQSSKKILNNRKIGGEY